MTKLVIAIPCYNEEAKIASVLETLPKQLGGIDEIIHLLIDDGSSDKTVQIAKSCGAEVVEHGFNRGLGRAFQTAINQCLELNANYLVTMDGDGQFLASDIEKLLLPLLTNKADFVTASRFMDSSLRPENIPSVKWWGNQQMSWLISTLTGKKFFDVSCGFRAYSEKAILSLNLHEQFTYTQEVFLDLSFKDLRIVEVPVKVVYFPGRKSKMASSIVKYALKTSMIIFRAYRDYRPLRFFWSIGFSLFAVSVVLFTIFFINSYLAGRFSGNFWAAFSGTFFAFFGTTFIILGIVVDMLDRIRSNQEKVLFFLKKRLKKSQ
ncbi:MAG: hypothetical protein A2504_11785 [Bdellovibrionales bacterium RIFOXYD12_FULL_39_22]|nr:MAG: hypothetical protein A2385_16300 [Bdellovibrionales bacterium RIFOXYB1_FULL_39_21]OFZ44482.1 MAG: hypothetical protein A2485_06595 [Bdellovibrionales bacterium RIFOXYC12_FULL_39_17]OFZ49876.1 MAG: hypothetical protein A2404_00870 [Bdellovibrionales bacterium RIFOXYC1_FULL_39_130]OFZ71190.1 MAG: hypothetical protein A2451_02675 [Bdellovibrionales bacterium RIFOXYC2_FULL_39_8]OFZ76881.1 MAG: hypothetical protein A2560_05670 [Bdellovibrionales bacterium RIFOXYD1_FULL_39_84]OFZ95808.1 MAG: